MSDLYCICRSPYSEGIFMIQCDLCEDWFHGSCVGISEEQSGLIDQYHCPTCTPGHGPMKLKQRRNTQRHNYQDLDSGLVSQANANRLVFIRHLQSRSFPSGDDIIEHLHGSELHKGLFEQHGFAWPILVRAKDGLGLMVPQPDFTVPDVEQCIGPLRDVNVIDVATQEDFKMCLHEWKEYFCQPAGKRRRTLNVISLEFSDSRLAEMVQAPSVVREVDWLDRHWPCSAEHLQTRPKIQKYCLMGTQGSYTDFHIDFGGSSVWYHILWGEKIFYMIRPTPENLALFEKWSSSPDQNEVFFGDLVDHCYQCRVMAGQTFFIPTGWIHAVLTPADSLVFGGNFLHRYNMLLQLWVYGMETRIRMQSRLLLPAFETLHWHVATDLLAELKAFVKASGKSLAAMPSYLHHGVTALNKALKTWTSEEGLQSHKPFVPGNVVPHRLIHGITKVLKGCQVPKEEVPQPPPLITRSSSNPLKLKINSKALMEAEERKKSHAETTSSNSNSRQSSHRHQPMAEVTVKSVSGTGLKLLIAPRSAPVGQGDEKSKGASSQRSKSVSLAGWDSVAPTASQSSMSSGGEDSEAETTATSDADTAASTSDVDQLHIADGVAARPDRFEMVSPGLADPSLPVRAAGEASTEEEDWIEDQQLDSASHKANADHTRGVDNSWHPGVRYDPVPSAKPSKKSSSKTKASSSKRSSKAKPDSAPTPEATTKPPPAAAILRANKMRKGLATAKQRLGKKLKLDARALHHH